MSEDKTCRAIRPSQVHCEVCNVHLSSASLLQTHIKGKKHQYLYKLQEEQKKAIRLSVYVTGLKCSETNEEEIGSFFSSFGKVKNIYFDKNKGAFAIVEFENENSVSNILEKEEPVIFKGKHLKIKKRTFAKQKPQEQQQSTSNSLPQNPKKWKKRHSSETNSTSFLPKELIDKMKTLKSISQQLDLLMNELKLTEEDIHLRSLICKILEEVFKEFSPSAEVVPYGSSANGLGCKGSDLDITLLIDIDTLDIELDPEDRDPHYGTQSKGSMVYRFVVKVIRSLVPGCSHVVPIYSAKCPVIKFTHQSSNLSCDLTINNRLGIQNTKLLRCYMDLDPRVLQLVYVIRAWAKALGISGGNSGQLTSYALTLMVIHFLQTTNPPIIPSLQNVSGWPMCAKTTSNVDNSEEKDGSKCHIDGWKCSFFQDITTLSPSLSTKPVEKILEEFFDFYGSKFDYGNCAVNIQKGHRFTILSLEEELQKVKRNYPRSDDAVESEKLNENIILNQQNMEGREEVEGKSKLEEKHREDKTKEMSTVWKTTPICVQDPFELTHNVSQNIGVSSLRNIIHCMMDAGCICSTFAPGGQLTNSEGIATLFRSPSKISTKRKKKEGYTFSVHLSLKTDIHKVSYLKMPSVAMVCSQFSSSKELFDAFCEYLTNKLQMKCDLESEHIPDSSGHFSVICTAWNNTWTHCRRERRKITKGNDDLLVPSDVAESHGALPATHLLQDSTKMAESGGCCSSSYDLTQLEASSRHKHCDNDKPVLVLRLILDEKKDSSIQESTECVIKLEHLDGSDLQSFENFYAFFKKQIQTIFCKMLPS